MTYHKKRLLSVLILVAATMTLVMLWLTQESQPKLGDRVFRGKTLESWFEEFRGVSGDPVIQKFRDMGPASVEYLAEKALREDPLLKTWHLALWPELPDFLQSRLRQPTSVLPSARKAIVALRQMGPPFTNSDKGLETLRVALAHPDSGVRSVAQGALGDLGPDANDLVPELINSIEQGGSTISGIWALGRIGPAAKSAIPLLELIVSERSGRELVYAAEAWMKIDGGNPTAVEALVKCLRSPDKQVRAEAAQALKAGGIEAEAALSALVAALNDADIRVRFNAAATLAALGKNIKEAIEVLSDIATDGDSLHAFLAADALMKIEPNSETALTRLRKTLQSAVPPVRYAAAYRLAMEGRDADLTVPVLTEALQSHNRKWQLQAVRGLKELGPDSESAVSALRATAQEADGEVRKAANEALTGLLGSE